MQHGFAPYRTILDLNQPGTYAVEAAVMAVLGKGALAWRIFDLLLLALIAFAMAVICRPHGRFPALFAAVTFALIHARDGLIQLGQRDLLMAALLASAYALLFTLLRSQRPRRYSLSISAGLCLGAAASIKPDSLLLAPLLLPFIAYTLYRQHRPFRLHLALACTGVLLPLLASLLFLLHRHALYAFLALMFQLAPYHASLWRLPSSILLHAAAVQPLARRLPYPAALAKNRRPAAPARLPYRHLLLFCSGPRLPVSSLSFAGLPAPAHGNRLR
jgi:hypothetical protein